jgi:hypothetical protein
MSTKTQSGGISTIGLLGVLFIALKLTGHINWSWWWVLAPFWIPFAIVLVIILIALIAQAVQKW